MTEGGRIRTLTGCWLTVLLITGACSAFDLTELGLRVHLELQPYRTEDSLHWGMSFEAYADGALNEEWLTRAAVGFDLDAVGPYARIGLLRALTPNLALASDLIAVWTRSRGVTARLVAGGRFQTDIETTARMTIESSLVQWAFTVTKDLLGGVFAFAPNLTVSGVLLQDEGGMYGNGFTFSLHRRHTGQRPVLAVSGNWALAVRMTTTLGFVP